jgi:hypothetical protein
MSKQVKSKLDQFTERLDEWFGVEKKTIAEVQEQLRLDGCSVSAGRLSEWWTAREKVLNTRRVLGDITSGAQHCREIDQALAKNPAPELETLIKIFKVLVMQLATKGTADPDMLQLANNLTITVCGFISGQTKAAHKERDLKIAEQKFAESRKDEQTKALEACLEEARQFPAVQELFKAAFAALKKAKAK